MMITNKFPSKKISLYAVYHKVFMFGGVGRVFCVAYPLKAECDRWISERLEGFSVAKREDFMVEEFVGTMKAWDANM